MHMPMPGQLPVYSQHNGYVSVAREFTRDVLATCIERHTALHTKDENDR